MGHEKLMAICHSRCCFGPKQWSAKWFNIFEIIRQRDMTFHNGALATYILSTDLPKFWNSSLSVRVKLCTLRHFKFLQPPSHHRFGTGYAEKVAPCVGVTDTGLNNLL